MDKLIEEVTMADSTLKWLLPICLMIMKDQKTD